jgi:hypothetical protein
MFTNVSVNKNKTTISIYNAPSVIKLISKMLKGNKLINNLFEYNYISISFNSYFIPDVFYLFQTLHNSTNNKSYRSKINGILIKLKENTWLSTTDNTFPPRLDFSKLDELNYPPLDYQLDFLKYYSDHVTRMRLRGSLLHAAAGSGKTFSGLALGHCLKAERIIVVSPPNAVTTVWEKNVLDVFKNKQTYWKSTSGKPYTNERIAICHYQYLGNFIETLKHKKNVKTLIILDESHGFNELKSLRTQLFLDLIELTKAEDVIFSSGSPIKAIGTESLILFKSIDPSFNKEAEEIFKKLYGGNGSTNLFLLKARLENVSFKVEKQQVMSTKPNIIDLKVKTSDSDKYTLESIRKVLKEFIEERKKYYDSRREQDLKSYNNIISCYESTLVYSKDIEELKLYKRYIELIVKNSVSFGVLKQEIEYCNKFENTKIIPLLSKEQKIIFKEVKTIVKYVYLKIQGEALGRVLGRLRIDCHLSMSEHIDFETIIDSAEKKTVIFSTYTEVCKKVEDILKEKDYNSISVYGDNTKYLTDHVDKFMKVDEINPLITTYASLSTAVPLIAANTIIFINLPFRSYIQDQAISRVHRLGANTEVYIYQCYLDTGEETNISTRGFDILKWSQEQVELITGVENPLKDISTTLDNENLTISNESLDLYEDIYLYTTKENTNNLLTKW